MCLDPGLSSSTVLGTQWAFSIWQCMFFSKAFIKRSFIYFLPCIFSVLFVWYLVIPLLTSWRSHCFSSVFHFSVFCSVLRAIALTFCSIPSAFSLLLSCFKSLFSELHLLFHACNIISYCPKNISGRAFWFCLFLHFLLPKWFPFPSTWFFLFCFGFYLAH